MKRIGGEWSKANEDEVNDEQEDAFDDLGAEDEECAGYSEENAEELAEWHENDKLPGIDPSPSVSDLHNELNDTFHNHFTKKVEVMKRELEKREVEKKKHIERLTSKFNEESRALEEQFRLKQEELQANHEESKRQVEESHAAYVDKVNRSINQLADQLKSLDVRKLLGSTSSVSDLECPVCLEEMVPPRRIWQCSDGHAICEDCRKRPEVKNCPTCRQTIVGRNTLAEKLAKSIYGEEEAAIGGVNVKKQTSL